MFTPLLTSALGSLPPQLYSHGSAIVSTMQQVAGAAGTALFITVMTRTTVAGAESGADPVAALGDGVHGALVWGAAISLIAVVGAFFVRRPATTVEPVPEQPQSADLARREPETEPVG